MFSMSMLSWFFIAALVAVGFAFGRRVSGRLGIS